jgi:hypothetical protein
VNKNTKDPIVHWVDGIREEFPEDQIGAHYSLKYNKAPRQKDPKAHAARLANFLAVCNHNTDEILIVNGSGDKKSEWNTVIDLSEIANLEKKAKVDVAYNPYFPGEERQLEENHRLEQKLASGAVDKVYLQFGTDLKLLENALKWIQTLTTSTNTTRQFTRE